MRRNTIGLLLVIVGALYLLQTMGWIRGISFGAAALLLIGLSIAGSGLRRSRPRVFTLGVGLWIAAIGLFNILAQAGVTTITGGDVLRMGWPLVLIALGISMLFGRGVGVYVFTTPRSSGQSSRSGSYKPVRSGTHFVSDLKMGNEPWVLEEDLHLQTFVGDLRLDLTTAAISPGVHRIEIAKFVGDTKVRVPDNVSVRARAEATITGSLDVLGEERDGVGAVSLEREEIVPGADAELIIDVHVGVGDITIERVPTTQFRVF